MISTVLLVVLFGLAVIVGLFIFGICKMPRNWKDLFYIYAHEKKIPCTDADSCKALQEVDADFTLRRNELLLGLGQSIVLIVFLIILAVLLLEEKIMEGMDLIVHPRKEEVVGAHGDTALHRLK